MSPDREANLAVAAVSEYVADRCNLPPGALTTDARVVVRSATTNDVPAAALDSVFSIVIFEVEGSESGFDFADSVEISVEFKDFEVDPKRGKKGMRIHFWNPALENWSRVLALHKIDTINNVLTAKLLHFTAFGALPVPTATVGSNTAAGWNMVSSWGAYLAMFGVLMFFVIIWKTFRDREKVAANQWGAGATSLEWKVPSPAPFHTHEDPPRMGAGQPAE